MGPKPWQELVVECNLTATKGVPTIKCLEAVFANILSASIALAGLALFVMLVIGSFKYLTSGGDPKQTETAQKTITYAVLGIVLIISSYVILRLIGNFTGLDLLKFEIPTFK